VAADKQRHPFFIGFLLVILRLHSCMFIAIVKNSVRQLNLTDWPIGSFSQITVQH